MNKEVKVVIGANYGDEGKGLVSYCLSREAHKQGRRILNVFYNGGAQRAHTSNGVVRHCTGAGTEFGADTYYNKWYMVDPIAIWLEQAKVYIHPECRIVLPCDIVNNQQKELTRGEERHGSCGMGIFEASYRSMYDPENSFNYRELICEPWKDIYDKLISIEKKYGFPRDLVYNNDNFMRAVAWCNQSCRMCYSEEAVFRCYDTIIFEGGQGLMLDQANYSSDNMHLTPSSPGIRNCISGINTIGITPELYYVSRSYLTRHGAGKIEMETGKEWINPEIEDKTNIANPWQGELRYGFLNTETLYERMQNDINELGGIRAYTNLVYTHLNYSRGKLRYGPGAYEDIECPKFINHIYASDQKDQMELYI